MREKLNITQFRISHVLVLITLMITSLFVISGCNEKTYNSPTLTKEKQYGISSPTLSPDNKTIVFALTEVPGLADIALFTLSTKELKRIKPTGKDCIAPVYSHDGKMMAFTSGDGEDWNLFVMNADSSGLRQLTHNYNTNRKLRDGSYQAFRINAVPTFSPDGEKVIFVRSRVKRQRSMGGEMVSHWDVYEVELATGKERQLTDYRFYETSRPYYLSDSKGLIFSAIGAKGKIPDEMSTKNENEILVVDGKRPNPYRPFEHYTYAVKPTVSANGTIVFVARTNEDDGTKRNYTYDIFMRKRKKTTRLTTEKFSIIAEPFISHDGSHVVFLASKKQNEGPALWLVKTDGTGTTNIGRPWNQSK